MVVMHSSNLSTTAGTILYDLTAVKQPDESFFQAAGVFEAKGWEQKQMYFPGVSERMETFSAKTWRPTFL